MKNRYILAALLLGGLLMGACEKDNGLPKGAIRLTAEGHQSHDKTSVSGTTVQWTGGETILINGSDMEVYVSSSGEQAYIDAGSLNLTGNTVYGYYNCGTISTISNEQTTSPTVIIPASYESSYSDGRQVIQMPMAAYASSAGNAIAFKNLTAAVKVRVKNTTGHTIYLDKVMVYSGQKLCGSVTLRLEESNFNLSSQGASYNTEKSVTVTFPNETVAIATGGEDIKEVQVPILPVSSTGDDLTIQVYTHALASDIYPGAAKAHIDHTFTYTATSPDLARNEIVTAQVNIGGTNTTTVDHSLFSVSSTKRVRFSQGNLQATTTDLGAHWTWGFAPKQWNYIGNAAANNAINGNGSVSANGTVDLFKWSTRSTYYGIHNSQTLSTYSGNFRDWGGCIGTGWETLRLEEWQYLISSSAGRPSAQYVKATVNGVHGLILFPDSWTNTSESDYHINNFYINKTGIPFTNVNITSSDWTNKLEPNGAVFLPAAGVYIPAAENGSVSGITRVTTHCYYWLQTPYGSDADFRAYNILVYYDGSNGTVGSDNCRRWRGMSVRLVLPGN